MIRSVEYIVDLIGAEAEFSAVDVHELAVKREMLRGVEPGIETHGSRLCVVGTAAEKLSEGVTFCGIGVCKVGHSTVTEGQQQAQENESRRHSCTVANFRRDEACKAKMQNFTGAIYRNKSF